MIVDCFTHCWASSNQLGRVPSVGNGQRPLTTLSGEEVRADVARHFAAAEPADCTIVLGFKSHYLGAEISNDSVATYVRDHPGKLIGFAGVDLSRPKEAIVELHRARRELSMSGIVVAPAAQDVHPTSSQAMLVYAEAAQAGLPVVFHSGVQISTATKMVYAQPILLDEIALEFPALKLIIAHMGMPWIHETLVLLAKHPNVYAEISGLLAQPWQAYQAMLGAYQQGVIDKLLLGSGFPHATAADCIEALYGINHLCQGTNLPTVPREQLRGIVERDALTLLGITQMSSTSTPQTTSVAPVEQPQELN